MSRPDLQRQALVDPVRWAWHAERGFDAVKRRIGQRLGGHDPLRIVPYLGHGTQRRVRIHGRVLQDEGLTPGTGSWSRLREMFVALETDEVAEAEVGLDLAGAAARVVSDEEGFFEAWVEPGRPLDGGGAWHPAALRLLRPAAAVGAPVTAVAEALVPPAGARLGVISDLDDTVIHTDATSLYKMARNVLLGDARSRRPFAGVATFYRALAVGGGDGPLNPVFYVSSSPWNIYDLLVEFLDINGVPKGPLFLRDWGVTETELFPRDHVGHKLAAILGLLDLYPRLPFVLIGDSGQQDPEIYRRVLEERPGRIAAIYIRNVGLEAVERPDAIRTLAVEAAPHPGELLLVDTTLEAARDAAERGWIGAEAVEAVAAEVARDLAPPESPEVDLVKPADRSGGDPDEPDARDLAEEAAE
jgi:phosphatidate phosphatase APP1